MTDTTKPALKPGYAETDGLRDSELWRAVAANLTLDAKTEDDPDDRDTLTVLIKMFTIAAGDSETSGLTPELAVALDDVAASIIEAFRVPDWTVPA